jgi:hypothetical protein
MLRDMSAKGDPPSVIEAAIGRTQYSVSRKAAQLRLNLKRKMAAPEPGRPKAEEGKVVTRAPTVHSRPMTTKEFQAACDVPVLSDEFRPWEDRGPGQCAAPVATFDGVVHSCCRPVLLRNRKGRMAESAYCPEHHGLFFYVPATTARDLERSVTRLRVQRPR